MPDNARAAAFRALHVKGDPFIFPNFWDAGSARILADMGFSALATTSSGFALTQARPDYGVTREQVLDHARLVCAAVDAPVAADLENGFGAAPDDCAQTIRLAATTGLAGGSIEDATGDAARPVFEKALATDRIVAAAEAARNAAQGFVLTARAEAFLYGDADIGDVIARLQAFDDAGADVLFAPGLPDIDAVAAVCSSVGKPVNVLVHGGLANCTLDDFAKAGAARISLGGALAFAAYGVMAEIAQSIRTTGGFTALSGHREGVRKVKSAIDP